MKLAQLLVLIQSAIEIFGAGPMMSHLRKFLRQNSALLRPVFMFISSICFNEVVLQSFGKFNIQLNDSFVANKCLFFKNKFYSYAA